jgi:hypothetical protein
VKLLRSEPVAAAAVLTGAITLGVAFGLPVTALQVGAIGTFLGLCAGLFVRSQVSPTNKP